MDQRGFGSIESIRIHWLVPAPEFGRSTGLYRPAHQVVVTTVNSLPFDVFHPFAKLPFTDVSDSQTSAHQRPFQYETR